MVTILQTIYCLVIDNLIDDDKGVFKSMEIEDYYLVTFISILTLPFLITYYCLYLVLIIISIPFKLYPIKIFLGIIDQDLV